MDDTLAQVTAPQATQKPRNRINDQRPIVDDHLKMDRLLHAVCHWFHRRNPHYRYEDLYEIATMAMLEARASYNPYRGAKLGTHVWNSLRYALLTHHSRLGKESNRCRDFSNLEDVTSALDAEGLPCGAAAGPDAVADRRRFNPEAFLNELSEDAATVVRLFWDQLVGVDPDRINRKTGRTLLQRALDQLSWEVCRFMRAVTEVRQQLG